MRAINLLPRDDVRRTPKSKGSKSVLLSGVVGAVLVTALLSALFLTAHSKVAQKQQELDTANRMLKLIPKPSQNQVDARDALVTDKKARVAALSTALSRRVAWDRLMREFSLVLPSDVWLLKLSAAAPTLSSAAAPVSTAAATPAAPTQLLGTALPFQIEGYTYSHEAVARLLTRLAVVPDLSNVQLQKSELIQLHNRPVVHFTIGAGIRNPGAAS
jgi:Tfp pilus assembly protein PilN